jgi:hypothetical protein
LHHRGDISRCRARGPGSAGAARVADAGRPTLSVSSQLDVRRNAASGDRAYELGTEDGRYPAMGFHTRGEVGGIWTAPVKLLDGIWFGVNGQWIGTATTFTSGFGYVNMALPYDEPGDIDETAKFPDAVAMVWRWTGDNAFRDQMYAFTKNNMQYMLSLIKGDDPWRTRSSATACSRCCRTWPPRTTAARTQPPSPPAWRARCTPAPRCRPGRPSIRSR